MVRAKFQCHSKIPLSDGGVTVCMSAVYSNKDGSQNEENKVFSEATPSGHFSMHIAAGKPAAGAFVQGQSYYVDFTPAD